MTFWTPALVEDWLIEAALVELSLPSPKKNRLNQPVTNDMFYRDYPDRRIELNGQIELRSEELEKKNRLRKQIGVEEHRDERRLDWSWGNQKAYVPPAAVDRHEEFISLVAKFLPTRIGRLKHKDVSDCMWAWAFAMVGGTPFRKWCRIKGMIESRGRMVKKAGVEFLAENFHGIPEKKFLTEVAQIRQNAGANQIEWSFSYSPRFISDSESQLGDYSDPKVIARFEKSIRKHNRRMRKRRRHDYQPAA